MSGWRKKRRRGKSQGIFSPGNRALISSVRVAQIAAKLCSSANEGGCTDAGGEDALMDAWDIALWTCAVYIAVAALVRLMRSSRDRVVAELRSEMEAQRQQQKQLDKKKKQKSAKDKAA